MSAPYPHIACCVDDTEAARRALAEARRLRAAAPGRLSVVHVIAPPNLLVSVAAQLGGGVVHDAELEHEAARMWLENLVDGMPAAEPVLLEGTPDETAVAWAREAGCDLLVVASHSGPVERALLGSFAGHLGQHAPCPVLLVPPGAPGGTG